MNKPVVAVLMTCFNRRDVTIEALARLPAAIGDAGRCRVFLVDDGSRDGTAAAVAARFPETTIIRGDGSLYWNGGMRLAWETALPARPDFYLWLNDDTHLRPGSLARLIGLHAAGDPRTIVVGRCVDPVTGRTTYGGYARARGLSRLRFRRLAAGESACVTMNGNCVLAPASAAAEIGLNCARFRHAFGDNDYGLRAVAAGYRIRQCSEPVAEQCANDGYQSSLAKLTPANWRTVLFDPKGVPLGEWLHFCRRHGGPLWMVNFVWRYVKMLRLA